MIFQPGLIKTTLQMGSFKEPPDEIGQFSGNEILKEFQSFLLLQWLLQAVGFHLNYGLLVLKATEKLETIEWEESRSKYLKAHCSYWDSAIFCLFVFCLINIPELL